MEILAKYLRLEVEGADKIPKTGRVLISPNHSGYSGFDAVVLAHIINKAAGRIPRVLTHHLWFMTKTTSIPAHKMGFVEATTKNGLNYLEKSQVVVLFPEGEHGNFKPSSIRYRLQEFRRGFIRMAIATQSPIIPTLILGAEETHINLKQLKFTRFLRGTVLPLPLNVIPLPAKWKIIFMDPIHLPYPKSAVDNTELIHEICSEIREKMQERLAKELSSRDSIFL
jgi:1-acyl-sn-glycerol-3-phosphate acyltransferase